MGRKLKVASLFCGCGGTDVGMQGDFDYLGKHYASNNVQIVYANDIEKAACKIFADNFDVIPDNRDIREIKSDDLPEFDILTGGFPCQSFSIAGARKGFDDTCTESEKIRNKRRKGHVVL